MYSGGRTGGWRGCSPPRGPKLLGASLQPGPKIVDLKKKTSFARESRRPHGRSHPAPSLDAHCVAVTPGRPLYRRRRPPPLLPGAPAGSSSAPPRLFLCPSPRGRHRPPLHAAPRTAPPGQRGRPTGQPAARPGAGRPPAQARGARQHQPASCQSQAASQPALGLGIMQAR